MGKTRKKSCLSTKSLLRDSTITLPPPFLIHYAPYTGGQLNLARKKLHDRKYHWNSYYQAHSFSGYHDRHYIAREFPEIMSTIQLSLNDEHPSHEECGKMHEELSSCTVTTSNSNNTLRPVLLLDIGCGIGSSAFPILEEFHSFPLHIYAVDSSSVAIQILNKRLKQAQISTGTSSLQACVVDLINETVPMPKFLPECASLGLLIFVLSSVLASDFHPFLRHVRQALAAGGVLYFRDYAKEDITETRFHNKSILANQENMLIDDNNAVLPSLTSYYRGNGTLTYFFTIPDLTSLFISEGFEVISLDVVELEQENRKLNLVMKRRFIQGRFRCV